MEGFNALIFGPESSRTDERLRTFKALNFEPDTGDVIDAFAGEAIFGQDSTYMLTQSLEAEESLEGKIAPGSIREGIPARQVKAPDPAISEEQWKTSDNYREGIEFFPGMTEKAARIFAERHDDRQRREFFISRASGGQKALGLAASFPVAILDPINLATAFIPVPGVTTGRVGRMMAGQSKMATRAVEGVIEGSVGALYTEPLGQYNAAVFGEERTMVDTLTNVAMGAFVGSALHVGVGAYGDYRARISTEKHLEALHTAVNQMARGKRVDVEPIVRQGFEESYARQGAPSDAPDPFDPRFWDMEARRAPEAEVFEIGELTGSQYRNYTPVRAGDRQWVEGVVQELNDAQRGYRVFMENEDAPGQTVQGVKSESPEWFQQYNRDVEAHNKERKKIVDQNKTKPDAEKAEVPTSRSILTKDKATKVANKMLEGKSLGKAEAEVAGIIWDAARRNREQNARQIASFRRERAESGENDVDAVYRREQEMINAAERNASPMTLGEDYDADAKALDEIIAERSVSPEQAEIDAEIKRLEEQAKAAREQEFLDDADMAELDEVNMLAAEARDMSRALNAAAVCMGRV